MQVFVENQLLALVTIMALGLLLGRVRVFGFQLGVAAVLFVGLGFATLNPAIALPPIVFIIGLSLFVYTIGLESGPDFFRSLRTTGLKANIFALAVIAVSTLLAWVLIKAFDLDAATGAGMFTGALTNTPAMAAVVDSLPGLVSPDQLADVAELPVVTYSLAYPIGVLGVIVAIAVCHALFRVNPAAEAEAAGVAVHELLTARVRVTKDDLPALTNIPYILELDIIISRRERAGELHIPELGDRARIGDILTVVGTESEVARATALMGESVPGDPTHDEGLDYRRIFVSNPSIVGIPLAKLRPQMSDMLVTRVRRGDVDMVATPEMSLQLGDRVRVVCPSERLDRATRFFGDSYKKISDINLLPLLVGLTLGVVVGMIEFPLPGGSSLKLGNAGGPLLVSLVLGALGRTGPVVWQVPYGANLVLRGLGITLFLAGIGTTAGAGFAKALADPASLTVIGVGALLTCALSFLTLLVGHKVLRIPFGQTAGILAGIQTHPAVLSYASDQQNNELPAFGYTSVYPLSMVAKIVAAQVLLFVLL
ncbi:aspartate:alanine exchanger family transporter [Corynebacterium epidermidicanis]|uniref:aspartate:alanine exchanger family transporter n=1 Tax=Corynebacterium epidermidicanis TaxID=1050174 RepID=UPI0011873FD3|nr:aspartate:alanine exchanger family transporter [Corynebacterium epidermidicanis]